MSGTYKEILNSDDAAFGGSGTVHNKPVRTHKKPQHGFEQSITVTLPPMSTLYFEVPTKRTRKAAEDNADKPAKKTAKKATVKDADKPVKRPAPPRPRPPKRRMKTGKSKKDRCQVQSKTRGRSGQAGKENRRQGKDRGKSKN